MNILLNNEITNLLRTPRLPGRLNTSQTAAVLGFSDHDLPILVLKKLLRPLGKPVLNSTKYYAAREMESLASDVAWLSKATQTLSDHWSQKNKSNRDFKRFQTEKHPDLSDSSKSL
jgi:hypothetical protein